MTTVTILRDGTRLVGFRLSGHAGYAPSGGDVVCAAASVLITTCANALESVAGLIPQLSVTREPALMEVRLPQILSDAQQHDADVILRTTLQGFEDVAQQYPKYLQII